jgi:hypothetical protein
VRAKSKIIVIRREQCVAEKTVRIVTRHQRKSAVVKIWDRRTISLTAVMNNYSDPEVSQASAQRDWLPTPAAFFGWSNLDKFEYLADIATDSNSTG